MYRLVPYQMYPPLEGWYIWYLLVRGTICTIWYVWYIWYQTETYNRKQKRF